MCVIDGGGNMWHAACVEDGEQLLSFSHVVPGVWRSLSGLIAFTYLATYLAFLSERREEGDFLIYVLSGDRILDLSDFGNWCVLQKCRSPSHQCLQQFNPFPYKQLPFWMVAIYFSTPERLLQSMMVMSGGYLIT